MQPVIRVNWSGRGHLYSDEEVETVVRVMRNGDPLTQGKYQTQFEKDFADYAGASHAFAVSSCTAALELSALLCSLKPGDEVIAPAHTFAATVIPFARTGARIVWADIDPDTFLVNAKTIEPLINERSRVVIVVHLYGMSCDMDPIVELARKYGLLIVEDAAQAPGASYRGRKVGSIGDFGCFSFHTHKNMTTLGEGGALLVKSSEHARLVPGLRHNGMRAFTGEREDYWLPAMSDVDFDLVGVWPYNFCLGEVQCALASKLLDRLDQMNAGRSAKARRFREAMADFPELVFQKALEGCGHVHHLLPARYDGPSGRDALIRKLFREKGVKPVVQYYPLYRYPMFQRAGFGEARCPQTDRFFDSMLSFPFHHWQSEEEFNEMIAVTREAMDELRKEN
ncbi:MAG: DegT/DnrJ/EryC1/StrS family aminotransferase [Spirochaetales bacterium]|nr:DegT/DnrJ/EryC1/StrS family aminotransferase [Spirochaetales bacterium]